ncbi:MAG: hypothetical protein FWF12_09110 [Betaproteobacteria bacterium]|nr:hypothetical protein [Betaproteobacteria bacterium]
MKLYDLILGVALLVATTEVFGMEQAGNNMCNGRTVEAVAAELMSRSTSPMVRVLVTLLKTETQDRVALDSETALMADTFRQNGAVLAEPISGQPLVVVEIDRNLLLHLAQHPQVACIAEDTPGATQ